MKFTINKPSVWMYETDDLTGRVSDELLLGTVIEILSESDTYAYVRTDYGYCGYINRWDICECTEPDCGESDMVTVYARCDLLCEGSFGKRPYMSVPKGGRVKVTSIQGGRFSECRIGQKRLFIPNYAIERPKHESVSEAICSAALSYLGAPYRWGGKSDLGIDCSGLAFMSSRLCGLRLYRDSVPDTELVREISESEVRMGDLAYLSGHMVVMTGRDTFVHASASACRVVNGSFEKGGLDKRNVLLFARIKRSEQC